MEPPGSVVSAFSRGDPASRQHIQGHSHSRRIPLHYFFFFFLLPLRGVSGVTSELVIAHVTLQQLTDGQTDGGTDGPLG